MRTHPPLPRRALQRGVLMLEVIIALGFVAVLALGLMKISDDQQRLTRASTMGRAAVQLGEALQRYVNDQYATLLSLTSPSTPAVIRIDDLVNAGYLPKGTASRDKAGFDLCGLVLAVGTPGAPVRLQGLLVSETPPGSRAAALDDLSLAQVVGAMGAAGGAIYSRVGAGEITGAQGAWTVDATGPFANASAHCNGAGGAVALQPGHYMMALWYGKTFNNEDVLYRKKVNKRPDLNTMQTPLGLNVDGTGVVVFGQACNQPGLLATDAAGSPLNCKDGVWTAGMPVDNTGKVGFGLPCQVTGSFSTDSQGQPFTCSKSGVWTTSMAVDGSGTVVQGQSCAGVPDGSFIADKDGVPMICKKGVWSRFDRTQFKSADFTTPGAYVWTVPAGVTSVLLSMSGGGEAGGSTSTGPATVAVERAKGGGGYDVPFQVNMFPGGSGGFVQEYPLTVVPGSQLCITVGAGGWPHGIPDNTSGVPGQASSVQACSGASPPSPVVCSGGGAAIPWAGVPGHCNVTPSGGTPGYWVQKQGSGVPGGYGLFGYGAGGNAGRCWGSCFDNTEYFGAGGPGSGGAVLLKWVE